jgi:hypothetical protein
MPKGRSLLQTCGIVALALCAQCRDSTAPLQLNEMRGTWAGQSWVGDASATVIGFATGDTLFIFGGRPRGAGATMNYSEHVAIIVPFMGDGTYQLTTGSVSVTQLVGGDVMTSAYTGTNDGATLTISTSADGIMEGSFSFTASSSDQQPPYGSTARFEHGRFRAPLGGFEVRDVSLLTGDARARESRGTP